MICCYVQCSINLIVGLRYSIVRRTNIYSNMICAPNKVWRQQNVSETCETRAVIHAKRRKNLQTEWCPTARFIVLRGHHQMNSENEHFFIRQLSKVERQKLIDESDFKKRNDRREVSIYSRQSSLIARECFHHRHENGNKDSNKIVTRIIPTRSEERRKIVQQNTEQQAWGFRFEIVKPASGEHFYEMSHLSYAGRFQLITSLFSVCVCSSIDSQLNFIFD